MDALAAWHRGHRAFYDAMATAAPGARVVDLAPGVACSVVPTAPQRSLPNGVMVQEAEALAAALPAIRALYVDAGVRAWTVWVGPGRDELRAVCEQAGLVHDGAPVLMHAPIAELTLDPALDCDVVEDGPAAPVFAINDAAYGLPAEAGFAAAFTQELGLGMHRLVAVRDGRPVACACWTLAEGDAFITLVAVLPDARGGGLSRRLMSLALQRAQDEGAETTTLEASAMGYPVYARMGYADLGPTGLWESRVTTS
ncbi:MAG TPA: GNAT family N-acetyltransferase [Solirubrobacteraceae bacterium]